MSQPYSDLRQSSNISNISQNDITKRSQTGTRTPDPGPYGGVPYHYSYYPPVYPPYPMHPQYQHYPHYPPPQHPHPHFGIPGGYPYDRRSQDMAHSGSNNNFYSNPYGYPPGTPMQSIPSSGHMHSNIYPYPNSLSRIIEERPTGPFHERSKDEFYTNNFLQVAGDKAEKLDDLPSLKLGKEISFNPGQIDEMFKHSNSSGSKKLNANYFRESTSFFQ